MAATVGGSQSARRASSALFNRTYTHHSQPSNPLITHNTRAYKLRHKTALRFTLLKEIIKLAMTINLHLKQQNKHVAKFAIPCQWLKGSSLNHISIALECNATTMIKIKWSANLKLT